MTGDQTVVSALPDAPIPGDAVDELRSHPSFDQVVDVRGRFVDSQTVVCYQLLVNQRSERLFALSYWPDDEWHICFDSADDSFETSRDIYHAAHDALDALTPDNWGSPTQSFYHKPLEGRENDVDQLDGGVE